MNDYKYIITAYNTIYRYEMRRRKKSNLMFWRNNIWLNSSATNIEGFIQNCKHINKKWMKLHGYTL